MKALRSHRRRGLVVSDKSVTSLATFTQHDYNADAMMRLSYPLLANDLQR